MQKNRSLPAVSTKLIIHKKHGWQTREQLVKSSSRQNT